jgi:hypothetical protein
MDIGFSAPTKQQIELFKQNGYVLHDTAHMGYAPFVICVYEAYRDAHPTTIITTRIDDPNAFLYQEEIQLPHTCDFDPNKRNKLGRMGAMVFSPVPNEEILAAVNNAVKGLPLAIERAKEYNRHG